MAKKISINDLAKELDVSPTTISFILNGKAKEKRISSQVTERVLNYIKEVGYTPNSLARSLRTGKSHVICLMVENIADPFFARIARLIEDRAHKNGYKIIYCSTDNDPVRTKQLIQVFLERHVDGFIVSPPEGIEEDIKSVINEGRPVILFDRTLPGVTTDSVVIDNEISSYHAVRHLIDKKYRNIAMVTLDSLQSQMQDRLHGYERALVENDLKAYIKKLSFSLGEERTISDISEFLLQNKEIDAVLFGTNYLAISGLKAISRLNRQLRSDLGLIAFDEHDLFELNSPSITAIAQPIEEMADQLITLLLSNLNNSAKRKLNQSVVLPTRLIVRESSKGI